MDINKLTIADLKEFYKANKMNIGDAKAHLRELRDKHGMSDREALNSFSLAKKVLEVNND